MIKKKVVSNYFWYGAQKIQNYPQNRASLSSTVCTSLLRDFAESCRLQLVIQFDSAEAIPFYLIDCRCRVKDSPIVDKVDYLKAHVNDWNKVTHTYTWQSVRSVTE